MLQRDKEEMDLAGTLCTYLLDAEASVTKTASLLYLLKIGKVPDPAAFESVGVPPRKAARDSGAL